MIVIISFVFGAIAQVVSIPFSFLSTGLTTIISPTGDPDPSAIIAIVVAVVLTQVVTLLIQSVAVVVQATATSIIYIDCRMRREGLDIDLLTYIERRDAGAVGLADPYRENVGRVIAPRPAAYPAPGYPPAYGAPAYAGTGLRPAGVSRRRTAGIPGVSRRRAIRRTRRRGIRAAAGLRAAAGVSGAAAAERTRRRQRSTRRAAPRRRAAPAGRRSAAPAPPADEGAAARRRPAGPRPGASADAIDPESPWS